jgi:hypothetical protein
MSASSFRSSSPLSTVSAGEDETKDENTKRYLSSVDAYSIKLQYVKRV